MNAIEIVAKLQEIKESGEEWDFGFKKAVYFNEENQEGWGIKESYKFVFKTEKLEWMAEEVNVILEQKARHEEMMKAINAYYDEKTDEEIMEDLKEAGFELRKKDEFENIGSEQLNEGGIQLEYDTIEKTIRLEVNDQSDWFRIDVGLEDLNKIKDLIHKGIKKFQNK